MSAVTAYQQGSFHIGHNGPYRVLGTASYDQPTNVPLDAGLLKIVHPISAGGQLAAPLQKKHSDKKAYRTVGEPEL